MKIVKTIIIALFLSHVAKAQETNLFVIYNDSNEQTQVLSVDKKTNTLATIETSTTNNFFNAFIIKPSVEHPNSVYLISAQENNLFLKRNNDGLEFKNIAEEDPEADRELYEWEIQYAGFPYMVISEPNNLRNVIYLENNIPVMKEVPDTNWYLVDNDDVKGNTYRYKIENISNTL